MLLSSMYIKATCYPVIGSVKLTSIQVRSREERLSINHNHTITRATISHHHHKEMIQYQCIHKEANLTSCNLCNKVCCLPQLEPQPYQTVRNSRDQLCIHCTPFFFSVPLRSIDNFH